MDNDNQHKFFHEFKRLEAKLRGIANVDDHENFTVVLDKIEKKNSLIKNKRAILRDLHALRNVFAHSDRERYIAEVNQLAFEEIERINNFLDKPPRVIDVFGRYVYHVTPNTFTQDVIQKMKEQIYTHIPIYEDGKFYGVFSETTLLSWLVENISEGNAYFSKKQIMDVSRRYLHNDRENGVEFIPENTNIFEVQSYFDRAIQRNRRLGAILITSTGLKDEEPTGIITAWDLPRIDEFISIQP